MSTTRASVETILIRRCGKILAACGLDGTTISGANPDLNDPIGYGIRRAGGTVAAIASVTNADLATVEAEELDELLDVAELRTLENALQNFDQVTLTVGPRTENLSDLRDGLEKLVTRKREYIATEYGTGEELEAGAISLNFQQHSDVLSTVVLPQ